MSQHHYTCLGDVRGSCGHHHRTVTGAGRCLLADRQGCAQQGGYSDRMLCEVRDGAVIDTWDDDIDTRDDDVGYWVADSDWR